MATERISIRLNYGALPRERIVKRTWPGRDGKEQSASEIDLEVVEVKKPKVLKQFKDADLVKTHTVRVRQTKEEREQKAAIIWVGDGTQFIKRTGPGLDEDPF